VTTTTFEAELATSRPQNMFKALGGIIYTAAMSVALPATFTSGASAELLQLSAANWNRLGLLTKGDGVTFARDLNTEEEESWGFNEPTRTDITSDVTSGAFTMQEINRHTLELYDFVDLSAVTPDATTGEWAYNKPTLTAPVFRRMIYLAVDGAGTDRRYRIRIMPRAQVVGVDDETWAQGSATGLPVQVRATVDSALGYAVRNVFAGPGQKARNVNQGVGA
jgi:hypothetical protein